MRVAVIVPGTSDCVSGTCFAESGNDVVCVANNAAKVKTLNETDRHPDLRAGLLELVRKEQARRATDLPPAT